MDFIIRPARTSDIVGMCDLLSELFSIEADFSADRERQSRGLELLLCDTSGSSIVIVAQIGDEITGMCSVQILISTAEGGPVGLLEDLVVKRKYRGNGIGTRLLSESVGWCAKKNLSRLQLLRDTDNVEAMKFYAGNGWNDTKLICMRRYL
jgi:ribosomal protein S18 acetylase RimI-like enzyme